MALNAQQKKFARLYAKSGQVQKSAIKAGYSKKTAASQGSQLLTNSKVAAYIERLQGRAAERAEITVAKVLAEIGKHAFADIARLYDETGQLKPIHEIPKTARATIQSVESEELFAGRGQDRIKVGVARKLKTTDKLKALELLGRHLKMFTDLHEHTGKDGGPMAFVALPSNDSEAPGHPSPATPIDSEETES